MLLEAHGRHVSESRWKGTVNIQCSGQGPSRPNPVYCLPSTHYSSAGAVPHLHAQYLDISGAVPHLHSSKDDAHEGELQIRLTMTLTLP